MQTHRFSAFRVNGEIFYQNSYRLMISILSFMFESHFSLTACFAKGLTMNSHHCCMDFTPNWIIQRGFWKIVHELFNRASQMRHNFVILIQVMLIKIFLLL
jgi:hypothetical protein